MDVLEALSELLYGNQSPAATGAPGGAPPGWPGVPQPPASRIAAPPPAPQRPGWPAVPQPPAARIAAPPTLPRQPSPPTDFAAGNELNERPDPTIGLQEQLARIGGLPAGGAGGGMTPLDALTKAMGAGNDVAGPAAAAGPTPPPSPLAAGAPPAIAEALNAGRRPLPPDPLLAPPAPPAGPGPGLPSVPAAVPPRPSPAGSPGPAAAAPGVGPAADAATAQSPLQAFASILARALEGAGSVNPTSPGVSAFAQGASGAIKAGRGEEDRALRNRLAKEGGARAERADTRADSAEGRAQSADKRADEVHKLNVQKLTEEVRRMTGRALTPQQQVQIDQIAATLFRSSRSGAVREAKPEEVLAAYNQYRQALSGGYAQPVPGALVPPAAGGPAPPPAAAPPGGPATRTPAPPPAAQQTAPREGATATNPQTGQRVIFKDGEWQPLQ